MRRWEENAFLDFLTDRLEGEIVCDLLAGDGGKRDLAGAVSRA